MAAKKQKANSRFFRAERLAFALPAYVRDSPAHKFLSALPADFPEKIAVACSGGADSVAALLLVWAHFTALRGKIVVLNFNHGTRPECADEARFVEKITDDLGENFVGGNAGASLAKPLHQSEDALRRQRLEFFREAMDANNCRILVQGHHAGDVVETALMRLARGSGAGGLCAPRPVQRFRDGTVFVRPLLSLEKRKIVTALRVAGVSWCEDASNAGGDYLRNRIRKAVVPEWARALGASPADGVSRSRMLLEEDDAALEAWADCAESALRATGENDAPRNLPRAVWRRLLWRFLACENLTENISAPLADEITDSLAGGKSGKWSAGGAFLIFDGKTLRVENGSDAGVAGTVALPYEIALAGGNASGAVSISAEFIALSEEKFGEIVAGKISPATEVFLNAGAIAGEKLFVRVWRAGDAYRPLGAPGARKLSDVFIDKKIPAALRRRLPVICDAAGILWVPGLPPAHRCRLTGFENLPLRLTHVPKNAPFSGSK